MKHFFTLLSMILCLSLAGQTEVDFSVFAQKLSAARDTGGGGGVASTTSDPVRDGTGQNTNVISCTWPKAGTLAIKPTWIKWDSIPNGAPYNVLIRQGLDSVFSKSVDTNALMIDLQALELKKDKDYSVKITSSDGLFKTNKILLNFNTADMLQRDLIALENKVVYQKKSGVTKKLMKAFYLNKKGWNLEADQAYKIQTSNTEEMKLIINMYSDFRQTSF